MNILGVSRTHDSSTCLLQDGEIKLHIQEERLSRTKGDGVPVWGVLDINKYVQQIDYVAISGVTKAGMVDEPRGRFATFYDHLVFKSVKKIAKETFDFYNHHHLCHAANSFYQSGFSEAVCVVFDGSGSFINAVIDGKPALSKETHSVYTASYPANFKCLYKLAYCPEVEMGKVYVIKQDGYPVYITNRSESYGATFAWLSKFLGLGEDGAGKTMGMAPYGTDDPKIKNLYGEDGFFNSYLMPRRKNDAHDTPVYFWDEDPYCQTDDFQIKANIAYRVQADIQKRATQFILEAIEKSGCKNVCISGGYALNCTANYEFLQRLPLGARLHVDPVANDSGTATGAARYLWHEKTKDMTIRPLTSLYLGPSSELNVPKDVESQKTSYADVAKLITDGNIVAIFQGRSEAGPRALGNRSILFDPRHPNGKEIVNTVKGREWFRPFAGTVLAEKAPDWFDMRGLEESSFMTYAVNVKVEQRKRIPCIVHVDGSCRIQTVTETQNQHYYRLIQAFEIKTGVPVLFNTSFNLAGDPMVETIEDAIDTLRRSKLEYLYLPEIETLVKISNTK